MQAHTYLGAYQRGKSLPSSRHSAMGASRVSATSLLAFWNILSRHSVCAKGAFRNHSLHLSLTCCAIQPTRHKSGVVRKFSHKSPAKEMATTGQPRHVLSTTKFISQFFTCFVVNDIQSRLEIEATFFFGTFTLLVSTLLSFEK